MLHCKNIKRFFSRMLLFRGKVTFNPNTLNNRIHTYFLADHWQNINTHPQPNMPAESYTYEKWHQLILDANEFNNNFQKAICRLNCIQPRPSWYKPPMFTMKLFNDWSIYGDGMCLPEYKAIGEITQTGEINRFTTEQNQYLITPKMGEHKVIIADQDTDAQMVSKMIGFHLYFANNKIVRFLPTSFRNISPRITNQKGDEAYKADWFMVGDKSQNTSKDHPNFNSNAKSFQYQMSNKVYIRKNQFRYNHATKVSSVQGYVSDAISDYNNPTMQGWRLIQLDHGSSVLVKQLPNKKVLIDVNNAVYDHADSEGLPIYPQCYTITLSYSTSPTSDTTLIKKTVNIRDIAENQAGIIVVDDINWLLEEKTLRVAIVAKFAEKLQQIGGDQSQYVLGMIDPSNKSSLSPEAQISQKTYLNEVKLQCSVTRYGKPYTGCLLLKVPTNFQVDTGGMQDFSSNFNQVTAGLGYPNNFETPQERINMALKDDEFCKRYQSYQNINQTVYQGKLSEIISLGNTLNSRAQFSKYGDQTKPQLQSWKINGTNESFEMGFATDTNEFACKKTVNFISGKATVRFRLNVPLTKDNNPRRPAIESLSVNGSLQLNDQSSNIIPFATIFYETDIQKYQKQDWIHDVGPVLKQMGLIYPTMQKVVDLFNFKGVSMNSMKRAFDIQDEFHSRYMPSTREISAITHRKIRKWLYQPLYNKEMYTNPTTKANFCAKIPKDMGFFQNQKALTIGQIIQQFKTKKSTLQNDLKAAFKLQLTTIPLYLSAMFSAPDDKTTKLLRSISIDEMKHLFIVSNILNAIQDTNDTNPAVPYKDPHFIPKYPTDLGDILNPTTQALQGKFVFDIQACNLDQIQLFTCIQLPGQINNLNFQYNGGKNQQKVNRLVNMTNLLKNQFNQNTNFKTIGIYYAQLIQKFWELYDIEQYINKYPGAPTKVSLFSGDPRKQFTYFGLTNMAEIYDLRTALNQLRLIVEQGEGSSLFTLEGDINKQSHYIKFVELMTQCKVSIAADNANVEGAMINFVLTDNSALNLNTNPKFQTQWTATHDEIVNDKISKQFCAERFGSKDAIYSDIYAKASFLNAYEAVMEDYDYIFNSNLDELKRKLLIESPTLSDNDIKRQFEVRRTRLMENAIARMKQMAIHADRIIYPSPAKPQFDPQLGSRPNYNLDFDANKSYSCPQYVPTKPQVASTEKKVEKPSSHTIVTTDSDDKTSKIKK